LYYAETSTDEEAPLQIFITDLSSLLIQAEQNFQCLFSVKGLD